MKNQMLKWIGAIMLTSFATVAICEACVTFLNENTYVVDESGSIDY